MIVFDDFVADPLATYRRVLEFLRVDYDGRTVFKRRYESRIYRYRWLQRTVFPAGGARRPGSETGRRPRARTSGAGPRNPAGSSALADWNTDLRRRPAPLTQEMRAVVADDLRADNALLSRLLQRDLGFWLAEAR